MAAADTIEFEGRRWPSVRVTNSVVHTHTARPPAHNRIALGLMASGKGQQWRTDRPLAFWRNYGEFDLSAHKTQAAALRFLNRHGDPTGRLDREAAAGKGERLLSETGSWYPLVPWLGQVAAAWDEPDALGISVLTEDVQRLEAADRALRILLPTNPDGDHEIRREVEIAYTERGLTLRPQTLRAFMVVSAASARRRRIAMRRCAYCVDWFELRRSDAVYCSGSCQATDHKQRND